MTAVIPPILLETIEFGTGGSYLRRPTPLEARVIEMLSPTTARLSVLGMRIDIQTPVHFAAGTMLKLQLEQVDGRLRLILKSASAVELIAGGAELAPQTGTLSASQTMQTLLMASQQDRSNRTHFSARQAERMFHDLTHLLDEGSRGLIESFDAPGEAPIDRVRSPVTNPAVEHHLGQPLHTRGDGNFPFIPQGGAGPLFLVVSRDDRPGAQTPVSVVSSVWTVRFTFNTPDAGEVLASLKQAASGTSIEFRTKLVSAADRLRKDIDELRSTLQAADIIVDELTVTADEDSETSSC